jgi:outer membrane murein-binding lipoprotein Lpp
MLLCAYVFNLLLIGGGTPTKGKTQIASQARTLDRNLNKNTDCFSSADA